MTKALTSNTNPVSKDFTVDKNSSTVYIKAQIHWHDSGYGVDYSITIKDKVSGTDLFNQYWYDNTATYPWTINKACGASVTAGQVITVCFNSTDPATPGHWQGIRLATVSTDPIA